MKKLIVGAVALFMCAAAFAGCNTHKHSYKHVKVDWYTHKQVCSGCDEIGEPSDHVFDNEADETCNECGFTRDMLMWGYSADTLNNLSADGYVKDEIGDFSQYVGTSAYRTVTTADELIQAIMDARWQYSSAWNADTSEVDQQLTAEGSVHVIEIANDLDLGFNHIGENYRAKTIKDTHSYVESYCRDKWANIDKYTMSEMYTEHGISKIKIENTNNLLVYSKNGAKLTHAGFSILSCDNVVFRNLEMDEMWQWEDATSSSTGKVGDYDAFGWAYFKVSFCGYIWIDHCTFGKSYDGQIDYSNPAYDTEGTAFRAPYGAGGSNGLHISWCKFNSGSNDPDGYLYKMMQKIEDDYLAGGNNYLYYKALRDDGISFEDILYGLAIPQKKGFLCGDNGNDNTHLQISFANCTFTNVEDRIPKLRGGNAVMYNCIVDSSQYYEYRTKLKNVNAAGKVQAVNSSWKCALSSQALLAGWGGSVYAESCIYKGVNEPFKNNDGGDGGYRLVNCSYQKSSTDTPIVGSTIGDSPANFPSSTSNGTMSMSTANFSWHTENGEQPFTISAFTLEELASVLNNEIYGAGVTTQLRERLLISKYGV